MEIGLARRDANDNSLDYGRHGEPSAVRPRGSSGICVGRVPRRETRAMAQWVCLKLRLARKQKSRTRLDAALAVPALDELD